MNKVAYYDHSNDPKVWSVTLEASFTIMVFLSYRLDDKMAVKT